MHPVLKRVVNGRSATGHDDEDCTNNHCADPSSTRFIEEESVEEGESCHHGDNAEQHVYEKPLRAFCSGKADYAGRPEGRVLNDYESYEAKGVA